MPDYVAFLNFQDFVRYIVSFGCYYRLITLTFTVNSFQFRIQFITGAKQNILFARWILTHLKPAKNILLKSHHFSIPN